MVNEELTPILDQRDTLSYGYPSYKCPQCIFLRRVCALDPEGMNIIQRGPLL